MCAITPGMSWHSSIDKVALRAYACPSVIGDWKRRKGGVTWCTTAFQWMFPGKFSRPYISQAAQNGSVPPGTGSGAHPAFCASWEVREDDIPAACGRQRHASAHTAPSMRCKKSLSNRLQGEGHVDACSQSADSNSPGKARYGRRRGNRKTMNTNLSYLSEAAYLCR